MPCIMQGIAGLSHVRRGQGGGGSLSRQVGERYWAFTGLTLAGPQCQVWPPSLLQTSTAVPATVLFTPSVFMVAMMPKLEPSPETEVVRLSTNWPAGCCLAAGYTSARLPG